MANIGNFSTNRVFPYPPFLAHLPHPESPWVFSRDLFRRLQQDRDPQLPDRGYTITAVLQSDPEWRFVHDFFNAGGGPTAYSIKNIHAIWNENVVNRFLAYRNELTSLGQAPPTQTPLSQQDERGRIMERWRYWTGHQTGLLTLPLWHATSRNSIELIANLGLQILGTHLNDPGYFGHGVYHGTGSQYVHNVYGRGHLLLNFVSCLNNPHPVTSQDYAKACQYPLRNSLTNSNNRWANYVPVGSSSEDPFVTDYIPPSGDKIPVADEVVAFHNHMVLPAFWIELQPDLPPNLGQQHLDVRRIVYFLINVLRHEKEGLDKERKQIVILIVRRLKRDPGDLPIQAQELLQRFSNEARFFEEKLIKNGAFPFVQHLQEILSDWDGLFSERASLKLYEKVIELFKRVEVDDSGEFAPCKKFIERLLEPLNTEQSRFFKQYESELLDTTFPRRLLERLVEEENIPLPFIRWLARTPQHNEVELYKIFSKKSVLEPLRAQYLQHREGVTDLLLSIPSPSGFREKMREEQHHLENEIWAMTQESPTAVKVVAPFFDGRVRYLKERLANLILEEDGHLPRSDGLQSAHRVYRMVENGYDLHLKERPFLPMNEYAMYNLASRIFGEGIPPSELLRFEVSLPGQESPLVYPVLASKTVPGTTLAHHLTQESPEPLDTKSLTSLLLFSLLTRPGDGGASNYIVDPSKKVSSIDNDIVGVVPMTSDWAGFWTTTQFTSILFSMDPFPLNPEVLDHFKGLSTREILDHWLQDVAMRESKYVSLFTEEEQARLFLEDPDNCSSPKLQLREGMLTTLLTQWLLLQNALRAGTVISNSLALLDHLITLEDDRIHDIGQRVRKSYERGHRLRDANPADRLKETVRRDVLRQTLTSRQAYQMLGSGRISLKEVKDVLSLQEAINEYQSFSFNSQDFPTILGPNGSKTVFCDLRYFSNRRADQVNRQRQIVRGLFSVMEAKKIDPTSLTIRGGPFLSERMLSPCIGKHLVHLDLQASGIGSLPRALENGPLEVLDVSGCQQLASVILSLPHLKTFYGSVSGLTDVDLIAPSMKQMVIHSNPKLRRISLLAPLQALVKYSGSTSIDFPGMTDNFFSKLATLLGKNRTSFETTLMPYLDSLMRGPIGTQGVTLRDLFFRFRPQNTSRSDLFPLRALLEGDEDYPEKLEQLGWFFKVTHIKELNLSDLKVTRQELDTLLESLRGTGVLTIDLSDNALSPDRLVPLLDRLTDTKVKHLILDKNPVGTREGVRDLVAKLLPTEVISLSLQKTGLTIDGFKELLPLLAKESFEKLHLKQNPTLTTLEAHHLLPFVRFVQKIETDPLELKVSQFPDLPLDSVDLQELVRNLPVNRLEASSAVLDNLRAFFLSRALRQTSVTILNLTRNQMVGDQPSFKNFALILRITPLQDLNLACNQIGATGIRTLMRFLPPNLRRLSLSDCQLGDEGAITVVNALKSSRLVELDLSQNNIGRRGGHAILRTMMQAPVNEWHLQQNRFPEQFADRFNRLKNSDQRLHLDRNNPEHTASETANTLQTFILDPERYDHLLLDGEISLWHHEPFFTSIGLSLLTTLRLFSVKLGDAATIRLLSSLPSASKSSLTSLTLVDNRLTDAVVDPLKGQIEGTVLAQLDLGHNAITNDGALRLLRALYLSSLNQLNLEFNPLQPDGISFQYHEFTHCYSKSGPVEVKSEVLEAERKVRREAAERDRRIQERARREAEMQAQNEAEKIATLEAEERNRAIIQFLIGEGSLPFNELEIARIRQLHTIPSDQFSATSIKLNTKQLVQLAKGLSATGYPQVSFEQNLKLIETGRHTTEWRWVDERIAPPSNQLDRTIADRLEKQIRELIEAIDQNKTYLRRFAGEKRILSECLGELKGNREQFNRR